MQVIPILIDWILIQTHCIHVILWLSNHVWKCFQTPTTNFYQNGTLCIIPHFIGWYTYLTYDMAAPSVPSSWNLMLGTITQENDKNTNRSEINLWHMSRKPSGVDIKYAMQIHGSRAQRKHYKDSSTEKNRHGDTRFREILLWYESQTYFHHPLTIKFLPFMRCNKNSVLTHWGRDKMADIFQTTFSNVFSSMKMHEFIRLRFHLNLFPKFKSTIFQHWFK